MVQLDVATVRVLREVAGRRSDRIARSSHAVGRFVSTDAAGRPLSPNHINCELVRVAEGAAPAALGDHGLRHKHAVLLLKAGVPVNVVAARLGHTVQTLLHYCSVVIHGQGQQAATLFASLMSAETAEVVAVPVR